MTYSQVGHVRLCSVLSQYSRAVIDAQVWQPGCAQSQAVTGDQQPASMSGRLLHLFLVFSNHLARQDRRSNPGASPEVLHPASMRAASLSHLAVFIALNLRSPCYLRSYHSLRYLSTLFAFSTQFAMK